MTLNESLASSQSLVLGATGIVGGHIVDQLVRGGERPLAVSRTPPRDAGGAQWFAADLATADNFSLPTFSTIFCTAHSQLLANALPKLQHPALRRVILFTSTSIITKIDSDIPSERDGLQKLADGEQKTIALCEQLEVEWTILRPTMIYDEGRDANVTRLAGLIRRFGVIPLAGQGDGLRQPVHAQDLAIGALQAARCPIAANKAYVLPGPDMITYREMVGRIFDGLNMPRRIYAVPPTVWRLGFSLFRSFLPNANVAMGDRMAKHMTFVSGPATVDFGWNPRPFRPQFDLAKYLS